MIILSVLIPTIPSRQAKFKALIDNLVWQQTYLHLDHPTLGEFEILSDDTKPFLEGGLSIGEKRGLLLSRSKGKYVCFLDDDDTIAPNYIETLIRGIYSSFSDVISFNFLFKCDTYWSIGVMSLNHEDEEVTPNGLVYRNIWHICPIKAEIAKKYAFGSINHGEDIGWLKQVRNDLKTEFHIDMILTQYNHSEKGSEADKIVKAGNK